MRILLFALLILFQAVMPAAAEMPTHITDEAEQVYKKYGDAIYQVQVIDLASTKKSSIGSGFQIDDSGYLATNYHVVAEAIQRPADNRLEYLHDNGERGMLTIVTADVVHDLALLKMDKPGANALQLGTSRLPKGTKLFSLGNPHDIGFTIIEGTFNGLSQDSFIDRIHFSGSLNPGMSGGPALGHDGRVAGINVATAGNQISFLVPVEYLSALIDRTKESTAENFLPAAPRLLQEQLVDQQKGNIDRLLKADWEQIDFGPVSLPGRIDPVFKCWGAPGHEEKDPFTYFRTTCAVDENIFLDENFTTGGIQYRYDLITGKDELNTARFYAFYEDQYKEPLGSGAETRERDVTNFDCNSKFVTIAGKKWKSAFCVRQYKKYPDLYDMHFYLALLGNGKQGLLTALVAEGVTSQNALALSQSFMAHIHPRNIDKDTAPQEKTP